MDRRTAIAAGISTIAEVSWNSKARGETRPADFKLKFGPHFGTFSNSAPGGEIDELRFARNEGFTAWEDNKMRDRPVDVQRQIAKTMEELGISMGVISALRGFKIPVSFAGNDDDAREAVLRTMKESVEVARRVNTRVMTVVPGDLHPKLAMGYQTANVIDLLKRCCDIVEPHGITIVLEPLNHRTNHPGKFLHRSDQAYALCKSVNRKSCKILFDIYHQQITEGNLLPNIEQCWDEIGYFQCGDNPGRKEPGTGEINYRKVFATIHDLGWRGVIGMEHGNSIKGIAGERAVVDAYRKVDIS